MFDSNLEAQLRAIASQSVEKFPEKEPAAAALDQQVRLALMLGNYEKLLSKAGVPKEARVNILTHYHAVVWTLILSGGN